MLTFQLLCCIITVFEQFADSVHQVALIGEKEHWYDREI